MGLECAGEVVEIGPSSNPALPRFNVGDRVMALLPGGAYAEYAIAHAGTTIRMPDGWSWEEGAACVEVFLTSYQLMRYIGKVQSGEVVLIHAGASGIGTAAIQLAHLFGAKAIVTAGTEEKLQFCKQLGGQTAHIAHQSSLPPTTRSLCVQWTDRHFEFCVVFVADAAFNYKDGDWSQQVKTVLKSWGKEGVNVILDPVGRSHAAANADLLSLDARWVIFALLSGSTVDSFDLAAIYRKRASLTGTQLRSRTAEYKTALVGELVREVYGALQDGRVKVTIDTVYGWDKIAEAHKHLEEDRTKGKVVCTVD